MTGKKNGIAFQFMKGNSQSEINLVIVHGVGGNKAFLQAMQEYLTEYNCYFIDLPGHGDSDNTGYNAENYINAVSNFVSDLDNVILIGHSLGGALVLAAAARKLPSVKGCMIVNSGASFPAMNKDSDEHIPSLDMNLFLNSIEHLDNPNVQQVLHTFESEEVLIEDFFVGDHINVKDLLKNIGVPTSIVCGENDIVVPLEYSEVVHKKVKNSKLTIIPKIGHMLPVIKRKDLANLIKDLLELIN